MVLLPREEEPQIVVPMIDVLVQMPGASAREVEERVTKPMEKLLWEIPGVEYIYSTSSPGQSLAIVRFFVGEDEEKAIVRLNQKMFANFDLIPPGASQPLVKPRSIDDVPILALTLWSDATTTTSSGASPPSSTTPIKDVWGVSEVKLIGGQRRQVRVILDEARMAAHQIAPADLPPPCSRPIDRLQAGSFSAGQPGVPGRRRAASCRTRTTWAAWSSASSTAGPSTCATWPTIVDGPEEPADYVFLGYGPAADLSRSAAARRTRLHGSRRRLVVPGRHHLHRQAQGHERRSRWPTR